jgi:hypothetical protein
MVSRVAAGAALTVALACSLPHPADAASAASGTESVTVQAGSLTVSSVLTGSVSGTVGAASLSGNLDQATWQDFSGSGSGWHGQIATQQFNYTGTWYQSAGATTALGSTGSGVYTGSGTSNYYTVTITSYTLSVVSFSYTGAESGTGSATLGVGTTLSNVGSKGVTITWGPATTTYASGMAYSIHVGNLATTALTLNDGSGSITAVSGTTSQPPTFQNNTANLTATSPGTPGPAVAFLTAKKHKGAGAWTVVPAASITLDNSVWAAQYSTTLTYTIASGP